MDLWQPEKSTQKYIEMQQKQSQKKIQHDKLHLLVITGLSGSGKSVALGALEDAGCYCVDNLPPQLLLPLVDLQCQAGTAQIAVAIDSRNANSLHLLSEILEKLNQILGNNGVTVLFLDANTETLVQRFSETRRKHPMSMPSPHHPASALIEAIENERTLMENLRFGGVTVESMDVDIDVHLSEPGESTNTWRALQNLHVLDTSRIKAVQLRSHVKDLIHRHMQSNTTEQHPLTPQLTLVLESFGFKRGVPLDADYVFDVRMLPNPHYEPHLRHLTGKDFAVANFLATEPKVTLMQQHIQQFIATWLPDLNADQRSYVTVAVGCTGGQHRSVYLVEQLFAHFDGVDASVHCLKRHRELI